MYKLGKFIKVLTECTEEMANVDTYSSNKRMWTAIGSILLIELWLVSIGQDKK